MSDTRPVRPSEQLDWSRLEKYLGEAVVGSQVSVVGSQLSVARDASPDPKLPDNRQPTTDNSPALPNTTGNQQPATRHLHDEQSPGGHSNLTYALTFGGRELVLRRPPF